MKLVLLLLACIHLIYCQYPESKFIVKRYPKKVSPGFYQLVNPGKYIQKYKKDVDIVDAKPGTGENRAAAGFETKYTVFTPVETVTEATEKPLFSFLDVIDQKKRFKKVLPDYTWTSIRRKRAALNAKGNKPVKKPSRKSRPAKRSSRKRLSRKRNSKKSNKKLRSGKKGGRQQKSGKGRAGQRKNSKSSKRQAARKNAKPAGKPRANKGSGRRLIAARDAKITEFPYAISIQKDKVHWCGGAILNPKLFITTANCLWKGSHLSRMRVRVGSRFHDKGGQVFGIQETMKHPGWKIRKDPDYDVALGLLNGRIKFSDSVHGVDLPNRMMVPPFDDTWVTSWGAERRDGIYDGVTTSLQVYHARLMDRDKCNNVTLRFGVAVSENFFCLAQKGKHAPCTRDTGAPAVSDGVLWGLASWGIRKLCGTERFPAMFSYLASEANMDFILNATHLLMSDQRYYPFDDKQPRLYVSLTPPEDVTLPYK